MSKAFDCSEAQRQLIPVEKKTHFSKNKWPAHSLLIQTDNVLVWHICLKLCVIIIKNKY